MDLAFSVIPIIPKTYDMAISSILRYYNAKTDYSISLLYDLNVVKISSKQLRNYRTSIHCHKRLKSNLVLEVKCCMEKIQPPLSIMPLFLLKENRSHRRRNH